MPVKKILLRCPTNALNKVFVKQEKSSVIFEEAIYLSSPEFYEEYKKRGTLKDKDKEKLDRSLAKYWIRSCMRSTPYATFAGCTLVEKNANTTNIIIDKPSQHIRKVRVDMNYTALIIQSLLKQKEIRRQIKFFPNNSIYETAEVYRYAEYAIQNNTRRYHLSAVDKTTYLTELLERASKGVLLSDLVVFLKPLAKVDQEDAEAYIEELCNAQILIAALEPCVTGNEPLDHLIAQLKELNNTSVIVAALEQVNQLIKEPEEGVSHYQKIEEKLRQLELVTDIPKNTLQVDLFLKMQCANIEEALIDEIIIQTDDLKFLSRQSKNADLDKFKNKFYNKYEDASIPLSIALDADLGIGYAGVSEESAASSELIDNLFIDTQGVRNALEFDYIKQYTLRKYYDYLKNGKNHIELTQDELKSFTKQREQCRFSNSQYLFGSLMKQEGKINKENFYFDLSGMGGPSAANLLGRFTQGDEQLKDLATTLLDTEEREYPDAIYAEIAHLPQARIGNILLRPILRKYEIPYVGKSGIDIDHQITIDDLMVNIVNDTVVLYSKRLKKRVIPRLTTAHNYSSGSLPIYKFLCDLQAQGIAYANVWDWGHLDALKHLPRVMYKNIIIKKARWNIAESDIKELPKNKIDYRNFVKTFREQHELPQRVVYAESDNELLIDFEEDVSLDLLVSFIQKFKNVLLEEFLFTEENCIVRDEKGNPFTNEIIIPVIDEEKHKKQEVESSFNKSISQNIKNKFAPYSEWIYFKIYCGNKTAEQLLRSKILQFVENGIRNNFFEHFFFIRYKDDFSHVRIRFYNSDVSKQKELFELFNQCLEHELKNGTISKIVLDTYNRELERYGGNYIGFAENIFSADSLAVLKFLNLLEGTDENKYRIIFALRGIDMLLNDFGYSLEEKQKLSKKIQNGFFKEFGAHPHLQKQLNEKYRARQKDIFVHMDKSKDLENEIEEAVEIFDERTMTIKILIEEHCSTMRDEERKEHFDNWLPSYIHMYMNRLFIAQQRKYELVIYHFLEKYYTSKLALEKQTNSSTN